VLLVNDGLDKNPGPGVKADKILQVLCRGCDTETSNRELNVTCVDAASIITVLILKPK